MQSNDLAGQRTKGLRVQRIKLGVEGRTARAWLMVGLCFLVLPVRHAARAVAQVRPSTSAPMGFVATLVGTEQVPPNASTAMGTAAVTFNADDRITYAVVSTGFDTDFSVGHFHLGAAGVAGPIRFLLDCNADGTSCSGTSRGVLDEAETIALLAGDTYIKLHTAAFPLGEIRGQLVPMALVPEIAKANLKKFEGRAKPVGTEDDVGPRPAEVRIEGRFAVEAALDLSASTVMIRGVLNEVGGAGELSRGVEGAAGVPFPLGLTQFRGREARYKAVAGGSHPTCRLKIKSRSRLILDFSLRCKRGDGLTIPVSPLLCAADDPRPTTELMTSFIINAPDPLLVEATHAWRCTRSQGRVRELKTIGKRKTQTGADGSDLRGRAPRADFRAHPTKGVWPLAVEFTNLSSDPDGDVVAFGWDFGDGTGSTEENPTHTYTKTGQFKVTLVVTNSLGQSSRPQRENIEAIANRPPRAEFRASPRRGDAPLTVMFMDRSSDSDGVVMGYSWDFGDSGTSTEANPTHTYVRPGEFMVTLMVMDDRGMMSPLRRESISVKGGADGGSPRENRAPKADFRADPRRGVWPLTVTFTNRSSDPDGEVVAFSWDFGDGRGSTEETPMHTYMSAGEFMVTLMVMDDGGMTSTPKRESISVGANRAPTADFRADTRRGEAPLAVSFTNRSNDPDGEVVEFSWDFGDGRTSIDENPTHIYTAPGSYVVMLMVTDDRGTVSEKPKRDTIDVK